MPTVIDELETSRSKKREATRKGSLYVTRLQMSRTYIVVSDYLDQPEDEIYNATGLPAYGYALEGAFCTSQLAEEQHSVRWYDGTDQALWHVVCKFDSDIEGDLLGSTPQSIEPDVEWSTVMDQEAIHEDAYGLPTQNSAGDYYDISVQRPSSVLEIRRIESYPFNPNTLLLFGGTVNSTTFYGAPPGTAFMEAISAKKTIIGEGTPTSPQRYSQVTYRIKFKLRHNSAGAMLPNSWDLVLPNYGEHYLVPIPLIGLFFYHKVRAKTVEGEPRVAWLNADGTENQTNTMLTKTFQPFFYRNFNALSLGPF